MIFSSTLPRHILYQSLRGKSVSSERYMIFEKIYRIQTNVSMDQICKERDPFPKKMEANGKKEKIMVKMFCTRKSAKRQRPDSDEGAKHRDERLGFSKTVSQPWSSCSTPENFPRENIR